MLFFSRPDSLLSSFLGLSSADKAYDQCQNDDDHNGPDQVIEKLARRQAVFIHRRSLQIVVHTSAADIALGGVGGGVVCHLCCSDYIPT